ncbi:armadillo-like helical [Trichoderma cornu-damae]|uniref:Armadillo-like helical n=1 Tax=Trichoderma cornu-damae TaxID=654480 RepID=A0A9P8QMQ5_9HYPO|nr:armadillo-like helical [Trichoderma cornu-damae]
MEDVRFHPQQPPRSEPSVNQFVSPPRGAALIPQQHPASHDLRSTLPRRFTTDSGRVPTLSSNSVASQPRVPDVSQDYNNALHKVQLIEKKKLEYERIREQRRRFELEMQKLDQQQRREAQELAQMEEEINRFAGHQSEPTTPPEYRSTSTNNGFPTIFSRPNRYSTSSLTSPLGLLGRPARSGSLLTSAPPGTSVFQQRYGFDDNQLPSRSVPPTRRNSDDDDKEEAVRQDPSSHRSTNSRTNRYSMPVTRTRNGFHEVNIDQTNTTRFLFGDDEPNHLPRGHTPDDSFPTLVRRDDQILSASSAALDLALSPSPNPEARASHNWRTSVNRHRTQHSMSAINGLATGQAGDVGSIGNRPASLRHSLDLKYISEISAEAAGASQAIHAPPNLHSSYSANDIPTVKNPAGASMMNGSANNHAQQHFHYHNASIGRIPAGALPTRHARELSNDTSINANREQAAVFSSINSALQASAAPFGPIMAAAAAHAAAPLAAAPVASPVSAATTGSYSAAAGFYLANGYASTSATSTPSFGAHSLSAGMQQLNINGTNGGFNGTNGGNAYSPQSYPPPYGNVAYAQGGQHRDSQARVIQHRRQLDSEAMSRYQNMPLESFRGQIYDLCKDQHGCRYLQKQLEERNEDQVHMIWIETNQHVIELMTDPFGNYLCQKLLEFCNDDERTVLIQNASPDMVLIALNQHGTRALQKMIEHVNTPQQVHLIIEALRFRVVELIQDLNGNHVIQKCLNKLTASDAQFIFDAVGNNCVEVGTHRHGCCVLQRCIDHATGEQKLWLIQRITEHARILVQDPFGNYVVQYIIDLNEPTFTEPLVGMFQGCVSQLSRHKFSSNVIEKCLRCAQGPSKDVIVEEMLLPSEMERLLRDSFANYVIQTALEFSTPHQKYRLVEAIRPILPQIRTTPYGRRIQAKIAAYDNRGSAASSGQATPADNTQGQIPLRPSHNRGISGPPVLPPNGGHANGTAPSVGGQGVRQPPPPPPFSGSIAMTPPTTSSSGGPVQPLQFSQMTSSNYSQGHSSNTSVDAGETRWV